ncbi:hypothetical protein L596_025199 [Steinernema carpocapsae]|uniref:Uncharacterized protein n=1 Tax=Steinernema carpocapsae TaxID=34508 RepID=A0A4U5M735_STECR|nr:hypothetical protein L596_025199 [Steinernema carpocapsae]
MVILNGFKGFGQQTTVHISLQTEAHVQGELPHHHHKIHDAELPRSHHHGAQKRHGRRLENVVPRKD